MLIPSFVSPPRYLSQRYWETRALCDHAKRLEGMKLHEKEALRPSQWEQVENAYYALSVKSAVMGYLESGRHTLFGGRPMDRDDIRMLSNALFDNKEKEVIAKQGDPFFLATLEMLRAFIVSDNRRRRDVLRAMYLESKPRVNPDRVENLVMAGGGAKALSLVGAIEAFEDDGLSDQIRRVAGTSGGAIIGMAYAIGYNSDELRKLVVDNHFGLFTLESTSMVGKALNWWATSGKGGEKGTSSYAFSDNAIAKDYHQRLASNVVGYYLQRPSLLKSLMRVPPSTPLSMGFVLAHLEAASWGDEAIRDMVNSLPQSARIALDEQAKREVMEARRLTTPFHFYPTPSAAMISGLRHSAGRDLILHFFQDILSEKLNTLPDKALQQAFFPQAPKTVVTEQDKRNVTFSQLERLAGDVPGIRSLYISMAIRDSAVSSPFSGDSYRHELASHKHPLFGDMPVAEAVRVSMNLPPIFPTYTFTLNNVRYEGKDGGLRSNVSFNAFDEQYPVNSTIGLFYKTRSELNETHDVERLLSLPQEEETVRTQISELQSRMEALKVTCDRVQKNLHTHNQKTPPSSGQHSMLYVVEGRRLEMQLEDVRHQMRECDGRISNAKRELVSIQRTKSTALPWYRNVKGEVHDAIMRRLSQKSIDKLNRSDNMGRIVLINTDGVETTDFKLSREEKQTLFQCGYDAMKSLLEGTYCLENAFHRNQFDVFRQSAFDIDPQSKLAGLRQAMPAVNPPNPAGEGRDWTRDRDRGGKQIMGEVSFVTTKRPR